MHAMHTCDATLPIAEVKLDLIDPEFSLDEAIKGGVSESLKHAKDVTKVLIQDISTSSIHEITSTVRTTTLNTHQSTTEVMQTEEPLSMQDDMNQLAPMMNKFLSQFLKKDHPTTQTDYTNAKWTSTSEQMTEAKPFSAKPFSLEILDRKPKMHHRQLVPVLHPHRFSLDRISRKRAHLEDKTLSKTDKITGHERPKIAHKVFHNNVAPVHRWHHLHPHHDRVVGESIYRSNLWHDKPEKASASPRIDRRIVRSKMDGNKVILIETDHARNVVNVSKFDLNDNGIRRRALTAKMLMASRSSINNNKEYKEPKLVTFVKNVGQNIKKAAKKVFGFFSNLFSGRGNELH